MTTPLLRVRGLSKTYGSLRALDNVSFDVQPGEIVAVLGSNGAGKTTTFRCILGITRFDGDVELGGVPVSSRGKDVRSRIGYVPQVPDIADGDTCAGFLSFICELRGIDQRQAARALAAVDLRPQANTPAANLSGGMKQRLAFAAALLSDPALLLLDEPTSSLDVRSQAQFHDMLAGLRKSGKTALIATHYANRLTGVADRALVLDAGKLIFSGPMSDLLQRRTKKSFVVNLNGTSIETFQTALAEVGVGLDRIKPVDASWDEIFTEVLAPGAGGEGARK